MYVRENIWTAWDVPAVFITGRLFRFAEEKNRDLDPVRMVSLRSLIDCNNGVGAVFKLPWLHTPRESRAKSVIYKPTSEVIAEVRALALPIQQAHTEIILWDDWLILRFIVLCLPSLNSTKYHLLKFDTLTSNIIDHRSERMFLVSE